MYLYIYTYIYIYIYIYNIIYMKLKVTKKLLKYFSLILYYCSLH